MKVALRRNKGILEFLGFVDGKGRIRKAKLKKVKNPAQVGKLLYVWIRHKGTRTWKLLTTTKEGFQRAKDLATGNGFYKPNYKITKGSTLR